MTKERKIKSVKTYTVEVIEYTDGHCVMNRTNSGFDLIELFGILAIINNNLIDSFNGVIKPDEINKIVIKK